jgi:hypothetical protein
VHGLPSVLPLPHGHPLLLSSLLLTFSLPSAVALPNLDLTRGAIMFFIPSAFPYPVLSLPNREISAPCIA